MTQARATGNMSAQVSASARSEGVAGFSGRPCKEHIPLRRSRHCLRGRALQQQVRQCTRQLARSGLKIEAVSP